MDALSVRLLLLLNVVVPLVLFMAAVYLALHVAFAHLIQRTDSRVLWFFSVVTGPLVRPIRALAPAGTPEARLRIISLAVYAGLWVAARVVFVRILGVRSG